MSNSATFRASDVFSMITLPWGSIGGTANNAVVEYITEYFGEHEYSSVSDLVRDLQMSSYSSGSLGMIYTYELEDFLAHNIGAIEEVLDYYMECTGEDITVQSISGMLVLALDVAVNEIAHAIEYADLQVIVNAVDYLDPNPEVIICERIEADDKLAEIIQARLDSEVQHSTTWLNSDELMAMEEQVSELIYVVD
jgi:hypothetical protein